MRCVVTKMFFRKSLWLLSFCFFMIISETLAAHYRCLQTKQRKSKHSKRFAELNASTNHDYANCVHHLCSNVTNYPTLYIQNMMSLNTEFHRFFGSVIQPYNQPSVMAKSAGDDKEGKNLCETIQFTFFPETALNRNRKRMIVVNVDKFRQAVSFETCVPKAKCLLSEHAPLGHQTYCKQQYNLIRLVSMTEDGTFTLDSFPVPSSCVCSYRRLF